ncbi:MAG: 4Fe-4S binding protein [Promethearchaeota archaeon]
MIIEKEMKSASKNLQKKFEELSKLAYRAITILSRCKSCGTCVRFCPLNIRKFNSEGKAITIFSEQSCGGCSVCYHRCPQKAIRLEPYQKK